MARAPGPITSPPEQPFQPYDATAPGTGDDQSESTAVYDKAGSLSGQWQKVQEGGAADPHTGKVTGSWPSDGTSDGSAWKQA